MDNYGNPDNSDNFDFGTEEEIIKNAYQRALKRQAMPTPGIKDYGNKVMVLPGWGDVLSTAYNQYRGGQDEEAAVAALRGLGQRRMAAQREYLAQMPEAYTEQQQELAGPPTPEGVGPGTKTVQVEKPWQEQARDWQRFGARGMLIPGMEKIGEGAINKAVAMPEKMAELEQKALDRKAELDARLAAQKELADQKAREAADRAEQTNILRRQGLDISQQRADIAKAEEDRKKAEADAKVAAKNEEAQENKDNLDEMIVGMADKYTKLKKTGGVSSTGQNALSNTMTAIRTSGFGQTVGNVIGTPEQALRDEIKSDRQQLLMSIAKRLGVKAGQLNSNVELQNWLNALTDPKLSYEASMGILQKIRDRYVEPGNPLIPKTEGAATPTAPEPAPTAPAPTGPAYQSGKSSVLPQSRLNQLGSSPSKPIPVTTKAEYDALAPGTYYVDPKGTPGRKPG